MTGELCDCYATKRAGVLAIKEAVSATFDDVHFFDTGCAFKDGSAVDKSPLSFASTNWLASATFLSERYGDALFVDIGSTTTDVIPIVRGEIKARRRDLERLCSGELIYSGILRTNVATLLKRVRIGGEGKEYRISSELFAITADAYRALGYITERDYRCESPDSYAFVGREEAEKSRLCAMQRLSRVVCSDLEEIGVDGAVAIAEQVKKAQVEELAASMKTISEKYGLEEVLSVGLGDFIVKEAAESLHIPVVSLSSIHGENISAVFPAFSTVKLLEQHVYRMKGDNRAWRRG